MTMRQHILRTVITRSLHLGEGDRARDRGTGKGRGFQKSHAL